MTRALLPLVLAALAPALACERKDPAPAEGAGDGKVGESDAKRSPGPEIRRPALARFDEGVPLSPTAILGKPRAEAEAVLGEVLEEARRRELCYRTLGRRTAFTCDWVSLLYADPTGTFRSVRVEYEDGVATAAIFDGIKRDGLFDVDGALASVGLELPTDARPRDIPGARLWRWLNNDARLRIAGREYRVDVMLRGKLYGGGRVELRLNDPLNDAERAREIEPPKIRLDPKPE